MNKIILISCLFLGSFFSLSAEMENPEIQVVNPWDFSEQELCQFLDQNEASTALEFPAGSKLPLKFFIGGEMISFIGNEEGVGFIEVQKTFYVKVEKENLLFSLDLLDWKPFEDLFSGEIRCCFSSDKQNTPSIQIEAEVNRL